MSSSFSFSAASRAAQRPLVLDGGMGRELHRMGAPFRQPEWSALSLMERPDLVQKAHEAFLSAGADVITANSYAIVPFHIGEERFAAEGEALAHRAGKLGRQAIAAQKHAHPHRAGLQTPLLAASLPPSGGSYRPDLFTPERATAILAPLIRGLAPFADLWLAETQGSIAEMQTAHQLVRQIAGATDPRPFWGAFTLDDSRPAATASGQEPVRLRSGEALSDAVRAALALRLDGLLFNCSDPRIMSAALHTAQHTVQGWTDSPTPALRLGVYANGFARNNHDDEGEGANESITPLDDDMTPERYCAFARQWREDGAHIIGGCCGIGPEHIAALSASFPAASPAPGR